MNAGLGLGALGAAAVVSVTHPGSFTAVYLADAASFLAFVPVLARLRSPRRSPPADLSRRQRPPASYWQVLRDRAFVRVWVLTALMVTVGFGQFQASFAGFATRPGGISPHGLGLAFAADMLTVMVIQLFVLRWLAAAGAPPAWPWPPWPGQSAGPW